MVATTSIGPNRTLHLVRVGEEIVLVGSTDHTVTAITRIGGRRRSWASWTASADAPASAATRRRRRGPGVGDRERAVTTSSDASLVERLRAMTTRR